MVSELDAGGEVEDGLKRESQRTQRKRESTEANAGILRCAQNDNSKGNGRPREW
jgi:hypothetical protein